MRENNNCHFCYKSDQLLFEYCYRCLLPQPGKGKPVNYSSFVRQCSCGEQFTDEECLQCGKKIEWDNIPYMLKPDQNIMDMMFTGDGYFKLENDRHQGFSTSYKKRDPRLINFLNSSNINTQSNYNIIMGLTSRLLYPIPPTNGYDSRKKVIKQLVDPLAGIFLAAETEFSESWLQSLIRSTIYHWDFYGPHAPEVANKLAVYFQGSSEHKFSFDLEQEFPNSLNINLESDEQLITFGILKEMSSLTFLEMFITSQFILGHSNIAQYYLNKSYQILKNVTMLAIHWLKSKPDNTLFLDYDYTQDSFGFFNIDSSRTAGQFFFVLLSAHKYHFEAIASNPATKTYNPKHGEMILDSLSLFSNMIAVISEKVEFENNKFMSIIGTSFVIGILNPWLWYYRTIGSYDKSIEVIENIEKMLNLFLPKVNPNRVLEHDPAKTMEGLLVHHSGKYNWQFTWISQYTSDKTAFRNINNLDLIYNRLMAALPLAQVQLYAGYANLARANYYHLLTDFEKFTSKERNDLLQQTNVKDALSMFRSAKHLPISFQKEKPTNEGISVYVDGKWIEFEFLSNLIGITIQVSRSHLGEIIENLDKHKKHLMKNRYPNVNIIHHRDPSSTNSARGTPMSFIIFEIDDKGDSWMEIDIDQISRETIATDIKSETSKIYLLLLGNQIGRIGHGGRTMKMFDEVFELGVVAISYNEHLFQEEIKDIATNAAAAPQLFDSIKIHLFDEQPNTQIFIVTPSTLPHYQFRDLSVNDITRRYLNPNLTNPHYNQKRKIPAKSGINRTQKASEVIAEWKKDEIKKNEPIENLTGFYLLLPLLLIGLLAIIWIFGAILWIILMVLNSLTIALGDFVFVLSDGAFIFVDSILVLISKIVIGYFTRETWFNWLNHIYYAIVIILLNMLSGVMEKPPTKDPNETSGNAINWSDKDIITPYYVKKGMIIWLGKTKELVTIVSIRKFEKTSEIQYRTLDGNLVKDIFALNKGIGFYKHSE